MRILAVIPARAGSKGIPNKSVRLIGGHPLVYYAIRNALSSELVTDVLVSTDSAEVAIIAKQVGALVKERSEDLCSDDVTLDSVVYDAIPTDQQWDYVITLQPTSPTLKPETLDAAIGAAIDGAYDALVSVVNLPRLSWRREDDGSIQPNYTTRLNRQWLPPDYAETGAFVISRASTITPSSRISGMIGVFEVPEEEAIDIDTFDDLRSAAAHLQQERVGIYVNGNNRRGIGHIYRALEIADEFYSKPDIFYDKNQTDPSVFGTTTHTLIGVDGIAELFERCRSAGYTLFINDILGTSIDYMIGLRSVNAGARIVNFEDDGEGSSVADLVFNALYQEGEQQHVKGGEKYYISPKTFLFYEPIRIKERVERVFISFGGADPQNYSDTLLRMISGDPKYDDFHFTVVLGRAKTNVEQLLAYNSSPNIDVLYDVANMPDLMSSCDIGVTSRGRTGYELATLGIPSIAMAQNRREEKHGFVCNENGFTYIGLNPPEEIIQSTLDMYLGLSQGARQRFQDLLLRHDLRNGRKRVRALIESL